MPAIRGSEYFNNLMGDLHDALSEINPSAFNDASEKFIDGLKLQVNLLVDDIAKELGYSTELGIPSNFKSLFSTLDFSLDKGGAKISLNKRGDGIKAQHIPIILKFIANHYKSISGKAKINPETIWGFEEPENNMEMANAFKLAKIFASFSSDLQIFINTHSPAFYSLAKDSPKETNLYLTKSDIKDLSTKLFPISISNIQIFDEEVGILPIITNYISKEVQLREEAERKIGELSQLKSNTRILVFSEDSDLTYIKKLFEIQGYDMNTTEFKSYHGKTNLFAAIQACTIELINRPDLTDIIFHRDSDISTEDDPSREKIEKKLENLGRTSRIKYHLFETEGYDVENYFINAEHINVIYPNFSIEHIQNLINEATEETKETSLEKLFDRMYNSFKEYESQNQNTNKRFKFRAEGKRLEELYQNNTSRFRYGKAVLGKLIAKLENGFGRIDLLQVTDKINVSLLKEILNDEKITSTEVVN